MAEQHQSREDWFADLQAIARKHNNIAGVRDYDGWTETWMHETPTAAYYGEFPEHRAAQERRVGDFDDSLAQKALDKIRRANQRGTGTYLTPGEIQVLGVTFMSELWEQETPRKIRQVPGGG